MGKLLKNVFTGPDNETFEIAHFLWAFAVVSFLVFVGYWVWQSKSYPANFGTDFLALNAGGAGGAWARGKTDQTIK